jgi:hypothetical protein
VLALEEFPRPEALDRKAFRIPLLAKFEQRVLNKPVELILLVSVPVIYYWAGSLVSQTSLPNARSCTA